MLLKPLCRYSPHTSTFIVECDEQTWEQAGFVGMSDAASRAYCETVFRADLKGQPLLSNNAAWLNFAQVSNEQWTHDNIVLLGDALRSVHFSIGSGTRTAMQDASALAAAFAECGDDVAAALRSFEENHRPQAQQLLDVAQGSIDWYENFRSAMQLEPLDFVMDYMTRGGRVALATGVGTMIRSAKCLSNSRWPPALRKINGEALMTALSATGEFFI